MRVLVTDGNSRAALAVTRSLGRSGHEVLVGDRRSRSLARSSRYCAAGVVYPDPFLDPDGFLASIEREVRDRRIDILLPITDVPTLLISQHRAAFEAHCRLPLPSERALDRAADKVDTLKTAMRLGVPTPRSWFLADPAADIDPELPYPVVIKPHRSRVRTASGWIGSTVSYAETANDLKRALNNRSPAEFPIILQEVIKGPGIGFFACYHRRTPVAVFSHRRIREKPPSGGVSVLCESVAMEPRIRESSQRLLEDLQWESGVAMVEFKMDQRDNMPRLMEINGRFWGSLQLAIDAGVDFPRILIDTLNAAPPKPSAYRVGVQSRWLLGDLDSLLQRLRRHRSSTISNGRFRSLVEFFTPGGTDRYYENPKWDDMSPWLHEMRQWFARER
jgi:predicted ATP-grasp superfamily ATP-dependent carboligase